jgi:hypothetical protein
MPYPPLDQRLIEKTSRRVIQANQPEIAKKNSMLKNNIRLGDPCKLLGRALYVEYVMTI